MKLVAGLLLTVSLMLLVTACSSSTPSGQELVDRAQEAAQEQSSVRYQADLAGKLTQSGMGQSNTAAGSIKVSGAEDLNEENPNLELKIGQDLTLTQIDGDTYVDTKYGAISISAAELAGGQEDQASPEEITKLASDISASIFDSINSEAKVEDGPTIDGQETWVWKPDLSAVDYQNLLINLGTAVIDSAGAEATLGVSEKELEEARGQLDQEIGDISEADLEKAKIAASGIDIEAYFGKDSGLHLGSKVAIAWTPEELKAVFDADGVSVAASVDYRFAYSTDKLTISAPEGAVPADSPAGNKILSKLLGESDLLGGVAGGVAGFTD